MSSKMTRRFFLMSSAALPIGCAVRSSGVETPSATSVRPPALGQTWRYAKLDLYSHTPVDEQIDHVAAVDHAIDIDSSSQAAPGGTAAGARWGTQWLQKYVPRRETPSGSLPSEVQDPWGKIVVDPHWSQVQVYESPIPLWPSRLEPGWGIHVRTKYKTPSNDDGLPWDQVMKVHGWETVAVPAGQFRALRYTNMINFKSNDFSREDSQRQETVWFAPEVGRWVARESTGSYYIEDSSVDTPYNESGFRWELLSYS